jgi:hypothetical protein
MPPARSPFAILWLFDPRRAPPDEPSTGRAPVHSFQSLLADLANLVRNTIVTAIVPDRPFAVLTRPTTQPLPSNRSLIYSPFPSPVTAYASRKKESSG